MSNFLTFLPKISIHARLDYPYTEFVMLSLISPRNRSYHASCLLCWCTFFLLMTPSASVAQQTQKETKKNTQPTTAQKAGGQSGAGKSLKNVRQDVSTHVFGNDLVVPSASWQRVDNSPSTASGLPFKVDRFQKDHVFLLSFIPANETFKNWKNLYVIMGVQMPCDAKSDIYALSRFSHDPTMESCELLAVKEDFLEKDTHQAMMVTDYCQTIKGSKQGKISVSYAALTPHNTYIVIYRAWKGKSFSYNDRSTWPVSEKTLAAVEKEMKKNITITPTVPPCPKGAYKRSGMATSYVKQLNDAIISHQAEMA